MCVCVCACVGKMNIKAWCPSQLCGGGGGDAAAYTPISENKNKKGCARTTHITNTIKHITITVLYYNIIRGFHVAGCRYTRIISYTRVQVDRRAYV